MDLKRLTDRAKQVIDQRGGTERLKQDAERLRTIATGPGTARDKAKAAADALKEPAPAPEPARTDTGPVVPPTDAPGRGV
jgi:hypothetical protein